MFYAFEGIKPEIGEGCFIHPDATIIGEVVIGDHVFIGAQAVLRGDFGRIEIGSGANIQETCVLHSFPGKGVTIGENSHIGHGAIVHGAKIGANALIGMNAVIMDDAVIGEGAIIGALSFVKEGAIIAPKMLAFGNPVWEIRELSEKELAWKAKGTSLYQDLAAARATEVCTPIAIGSPNGRRETHYEYPNKSEI